MDAIPADNQVESAQVAPSANRDPHCLGSGTLWRKMPRSCLAAIDTDRPHRTDTPNTVQPGYVQSEVGIASLEAPTTNTGSTLHLFDMLVKLGVSERVDVQLGYAPITMRHRGDRAGWLGSANLVTGRSLYARSKVRLYGGDRDAVGITIAPVLSLPLHRAEAIEAGGTLLFGAELSERVSWELNGSVFWEQEEGTDRRVPHFVPCSAVTVRLFGPIKGFGELYLERPMAGSNDAWTGTVDSGLLWLLNNDLQADAAIYLGTNSRVPAYTVTLGLSFRL